MSAGVLPIRVRIDAEDALLAELGGRLLKEFGGKYALEGAAQTWGGKGNINKRIPRWNAGAPFALPRLVLRDLDSLAPPDGVKNCPATETARLLGKREKSANLILRFAVTEGESWLLADCEALANFLGVRREMRIDSADAVKNPKERIVALAGESRRREIRKGLSPAPDSGRKVGPAYNGILAEFVRESWSPKRAKKRSKSLRRTLGRLAAFANGV